MESPEQHNDVENAEASKTDVQNTTPLQNYVSETDSLSDEEDNPREVSVNFHSLVTDEGAKITTTVRRRSCIELDPASNDTRQPRRRRIVTKRFGGYDIDTKHREEPHFVALVAEEMYLYLREIEKKKVSGDGFPLEPAVTITNYDQKRTRFLNWLFEINVIEGKTNSKPPPIPTNTIHIAMYYIDRFVENCKDTSSDVMTILMCGLYLASKFEDYTPVNMTWLGKRLCKTDRERFNYGNALLMEIDYLETLKDFLAPTSTAFVHRYLQAVDMETMLSAVHTARYFCTLGLVHYPFTGEYYSKIAAASAFIAYNKYALNDLTSHIRYLPALKHHSEYELLQLEPIVMELVTIAKRVEKICNDKSNVKNVRLLSTEPIWIYKYYSQVGVTTTHTLPDFGPFFERHRGRLERKARTRGDSQPPASARSATAAD